MCHHSSFMKVKKNVNKRGVSKNSDCPASILIQIKKNNKNVRYKDPYVKVINYYCRYLLLYSYFNIHLKLEFKN